MPLRIGMLAYEFPSTIDEAVVSGEVKNPYSLARGLQERGHEVTIYNVPFLTRDVARPTRRKSAEFEIWDLPEGRAAGVVRYGWRSLNVARFLLASKTPAFDVVHAQAPALAAGVLLARRRQSALRDTRLVTTGHGTNLPEADADGTASLRQRLRVRNARLVVPIDRFGFRGSDAVVSVSHFQRDEMERLYGVDSDKIAIIHNGIDLERYNSAAQPTTRIQAGPGPTLLFVGRLTPKKGLQHLLAALPEVRKRLPDARLVVVGGSPIFDFYGAELRALARTLNLDGCVEWHMSVSERELPGFYAAADLCVFPSEGYESLPTVALEAMAVGVPVVTTRSWGTPEATGDDHPGLIEEGRPEIIAETVVRLLTSDDLRTSALTAQNERIGSFSLDNCVRLHEETYAPR